jgi:iron-sulfur cluster repair protein YtfE (RIC family)
MEARRHTSRTLSDEHRATIDLLARTAKALARSDATPPDRAIAELDRHLRLDVERHFQFEEQELFPRVADAGDADLVTLLCEEHVSINEVTAQLLPLTAAAAQSKLDAAGWSELRRHVGELSERLLSHIEKEEAALVPLVDDALDDDTDRDLVLAYTSR